MKAIVEIRGQQALTTSEAVAEGCGIQHKNLLTLIRKYGEEFATLGAIAFETRKGQPLPQGGFAKATEVAILNEDQATFAITLFRNTPAVVRFKLSLVKAFRKALNQIQRDFANPPRQSILKAKRASNKPMLEALIEIREELGKPTGAVQFMSEAKLCNWALTGRFEGLDESTLSNDEAELLEAIRDRNRAFLLAGLDYADRKARLFEFATRYRTRLLTHHQGREAA